MQITLVAGARPNFIKIAPVVHALDDARKKGAPVRYRLIHTGQHYDRKMSGMFFEELGIPEPDANLECGGGSQAQQTAAILLGFERELLEHPCDLVLVVGDVTSTMACAVTAKKLNIRVAHVEAGIRSFDRTMPEEINRILTDSITDYFFTTTRQAADRLLQGGCRPETVFFVGNVMIDTLVAQSGRLRKPHEYDELRLQEKEYLVLTLHRPANVDERGRLERTIGEIGRHAGGLPVVFPIHPRTARIFTELESLPGNLKIIDPLGYLEFNYLVKHSLGVLTDSGGITEETSFMGVPCLTLRDNTERPETCELGTNELIGTDPRAIGPALEKLLSGHWKKGGSIPLWEGKAAERIVEILCRL